MLEEIFNYGEQLSDEKEYIVFEDLFRCWFSEKESSSIELISPSIVAECELRGSSTFESESKETDDIETSKYDWSERWETEDIESSKFWYLRSCRQRIGPMFAIL